MKKRIKVELANGFVEFEVDMKEIDKTKKEILKPQKLKLIEEEVMPKSLFTLRHGS